MRILRRSETDSSIPTSSMADIAFLLIIFFMVTTVFSMSRGLDLQLASDEADSGVEPDPGVLIQVQEDRILVDCREMEIDGILPYLAPRLTANPQRPVILYTDAHSPYRRMIEVYDLLAGAGRAAAPTRSALKTCSFQREAT